MSLDEEIAALRRAGRHAEAADRLVAAGRALEAAKLYAEVWRWDDAISLSRDAGAVVDAYRYALSANDRVKTRELREELETRPREAVEAAEIAEDRARYVDAARLRAAAGELERAAALYERAGSLFEAAQAYEKAGDYRSAGRRYEERLREDPEDVEAALRLGTILSNFGRWEHAIRALQIAELDDTLGSEALALMVGCFAAAGLEQAAGECLDRLRAREPETPTRVEEFLELRFGDPAGLAAAKDRDGGTLLAGRYRVIEPIGAGATGRVLRAREGFYQREVAIKVLQVSGSHRGRDAYARFAREARISTGIEHPNVVRVHEFNAEGPFLVMELMAGGTLEDRLERTSSLMELREVRAIAEGVLTGLGAVHRRGVVHRDLKPANVFFGATGDVKIGDFGVAHLQDLGATLTGAMLGTLAFMSPEQITGSGAPHAATDLYAFGVILFRLLTGELPFPGPDFVTQHLESPPPRVSEKRPSLGERFDSLVEDLLRKEVSERPEGIEVVLDRIAALDWSDPEVGALGRLVAEERRPRAKPHAAVLRKVAGAPPGQARYTPVDPAVPELVHDSELDRTVRRIEVDVDRAAQLKAYAGADHPFLQAIFDVDEGVAILEEPRGKPLAEAKAEMDEGARMRAMRQLRAALDALHERGLGHGQVDATHVRIGAGRAVLLLPREAKPASATAAQDRAALVTLFV